ncbi:hypothetical protein KKH82_05480, partial [Patescibacteria group bacterium]|nr:hypothetical protein [Patescibacteria group bacterium]
MPKTKRFLFDPKITPKNLANTKDTLDKKAIDTVIDTLETYDKMRNVVQGGIEYNLTDLWDEYYRLYMAIRNNEDHNYNGQATVFMPIARRAVNVIESEASNALFSREDYFSVDGVGKTNTDMARRSFQILKHYSDENDYVSEYELCLKQCLIYGLTVGEVDYQKEFYSNLERKQVTEPVNDEFSGNAMIDKNKKEMTKQSFKIFR